MTDYESYKLCSDLRPREYCLVVEQYRDGIFERLYHQHIPRHRLSESSRIEMLKAVVVRYEMWSPEAIVSGFVNSQGRNPARADGFRMHVTYSEPGVLRTYCGTDTMAWLDLVVSPTSFRQEASGAPSGLDSV